MRENVEAGSNVYSDALNSYEGMEEFEHPQASVQSGMLRNGRDRMRMVSLA